MIIFSNAKINLGLFILLKREDGFHEISSLKYPVPLYDVIEILPSSSFELEVIGNEIQGDTKDNLIWRAYQLLKEEYEIEPVRIILQKNIPMGAGLGGGSSNATFVLKGLNDFFQLNISEDKLRERAGILGSDCPFFVANTPQLATGKGEKLSSFDFSLKGHFLYLIHPNIHVSTADAYSKVEPIERSFVWSRLKQFDFEQWQNELLNDFEKSVFAVHPEIGELKNKLYEHGAKYASMSGSGSSVYGIFEKKPKLLDLDYDAQFVLEL